MSNIIPIGASAAFRLVCKHTGGAGSEWFDPTSVSFSFLRPDGTEEVLTYVGGEPGDNQVSRVSVGIYDAFLNVSQAGIWMVRGKWVHTSSGVTSVGKSKQLAFTVESDAHLFVDS